MGMEAMLRRKAFLRVRALLKHKTTHKRCSGLSQWSTNEWMNEWMKNDFWNLRLVKVSNRMDLSLKKKIIVDTVIMNPPFGTKMKGIDSIFLEKAFEVWIFQFVFQHYYKQFFNLFYFGKTDSLNCGVLSPQNINSWLYCEKSNAMGGKGWCDCRVEVWYSTNVQIPQTEVCWHWCRFPSIWCSKSDTSFKKLNWIFPRTFHFFNIS